MSYKIGVIGDKDSVLPFKLFGFDVRFSYDAANSTALLNEMAEKNYGIIYITEPEAAKIPEVIARFQEKMTPAVILIPNHAGSLGIGQGSIQENVEKAVGQNILQPKE
ncbi:V-type ATP synthase subunit F [Enterococcus timonensis]|uniref:V-type ATP synthase subunit F n=1 Tax=Enterococcus timonensis TaxID=1852364 RepID=UPI0008D9E80A|nr:V-type ATP synthase subunit F [Enterococcus timonensis]